jgi:hypothetical protein
MMMLDWKRCRSYLAAAAVAASLGACGGSGGPTTPPPTTLPPTPCTQTVVVTDAGPANARTLYINDFSVPDSGRLDITMDWTNAASPVGFYLVPANTCTLDEFNARSCNFLVRSEPSSVKPRKISVANFNAGNYRWMLGTFGDTDESISFQIVLSKGPCAALSGAQPSLSAQGRGLFPTFTRAKSR